MCTCWPFQTTPPTIYQCQTLHYGILAPVHCARAMIWFTLSHRAVRLFYLGNTSYTTPAVNNHHVWNRPYLLNLDQSPETQNYHKAGPYFDKTESLFSAVAGNILHVSMIPKFKIFNQNIVWEYTAVIKFPKSTDVHLDSGKRAFSTMSR